MFLHLILNELTAPVFRKQHSFCKSSVKLTTHMSAFWRLYLHGILSRLVNLAVYALSDLGILQDLPRGTRKCC